MRLRGTILSSGVVVSLLSIKAPEGLARDDHLPRRQACMPALQGDEEDARSFTRFRLLERRLRSGTVLRIFVTKSGFAGKYTRFTVGRNRPPLRSDACSRPDNTSMRCPRQRRRALLTGATRRRDA